MMIEEPTTKNNLEVDCISRQALLNATVKKSSIWNHITNSEGDNLEAIVSKLPPVTPQARWIPVSEKLPEDSGEYLVSLADEDSTSDYEAVGMAWFAHPKDYDLSCEEGGEWRELAFGEVVTAWMPLPSAYKRGEEV